MGGVALPEPSGESLDASDDALAILETRIPAKGSVTENPQTGIAVVHLAALSSASEVTFLYY